MIVGEPDEGSKTFTLYTKVFTEQSEFRAAARKPEWTAQDPRKPVDLKSEDVGTFQVYLNCVLFGAGTIQQWGDDYTLKYKGDENSNEADEAGGSVFERLIQLCLLATRLIDYSIANMAIDQLLYFQERSGYLPFSGLIDLVYTSTTQGSPLRQLMCDFWIYRFGGLSDWDIRSDDVPHEFLQDLVIGLFRIVGKWRDIPHFRFDMHRDDVCYYHFHGDKHPRCVPKGSSEAQSKCIVSSDAERVLRADVVV